jgi:GAF domain-containing protein/HAMP domain-containing protein
MTIEAQTPVETSGRNSLSLRAKLIFAFTLLSAIVSFLTARGMYTNLQNQALAEFKNRALGIVKLASLQLNGDDFQQIASNQDEGYERVRLQNLLIRSSDQNIKNIFTLRKDDQGLYFVVDAAEPGEEKTAAFGERYVTASEILVGNFDTMTDAIVEAEISTNQDGSFLSAYAPILTSDGEHVGVIVVDILADDILQRQRQVLFVAFGVFLIALVLGAFFGLVAGNALTEPVNELIKGARAFAAGELDQQINLTTRDEIEDLAKTFNSMAGEIQGLISGLELRVAERTQDLEKRSKELESANQRTRRRAAQFEALAQVTQSITAIRDLQALLPRITTVVSDKFGFYHVGIFLLDEISEYAVLIAANSAGGKTMLARNHRLRVGEEGIVGHSASTGKPRIALDVGNDAVYFNNPDLPETHSEVALPLISKNIIVGILDVQSIEVAAFTNEDIQMLSLLADQVSLAIENARLFDETRKALAESEMMTRRSTREAWSRLPEQQKLLGYRYDVAGASPLKQFVNLAKLSSGESKPQKTESTHTVVPIELRGEVIGELVVQSPSGKAWSEDQIDLIKAVAERVALSAENARLFEETTARADRERLVSEITSKIRSNNDPQSMIQTAIQELRGALGASRVDVIPQSNSGSEKDSKQGKVKP